MDVRPRPLTSVFIALRALPSPDRGGVPSKRMDADRTFPRPHGLGLDPPTPPPPAVLVAELNAQVADLSARVAELNAQLQAKSLEAEDARRRAADAEVRAHQAAELAGHAEVLAEQAEGRVAEAEGRAEKAEGRELDAEGRAHAAEGRIGELEHLQALARHRETELNTELQDSMAERADLRRRLARVELSLSTALADAGGAAAERARAERLLAERDAARVHAETERRRADASTSRATRAEARLFVLRSPLLSADRRLAMVTESLREGGVDQRAPEVPERVVDLRDHDPEAPDPAPSEGGSSPGW